MDALSMLADRMFRQDMTSGKKTKAAKVMRDMDPRDMDSQRALHTELKVVGKAVGYDAGSSELWIFPDKSGLYLVHPVPPDRTYLVTYAGDNVTKDVKKLKPLSPA